MGLARMEWRVAQTDSDWERLLLFQIRATDLPEPVTQWRFHPTRKWRLDFAWVPGQNGYNGTDKVAVEVQGGIWMHKGGHTTGTGISRDCEKLTEASILGWRVVLVTPEMIEDGRALDAIQRIMGGSDGN